MKLGIKQKILLVLAGVLALTIGLVALLASYYTNRQNEQAAFAELSNDLLAWRGELQSSALQINKAALAAVGDEIVLTQLAEMLTIELQADDSAKASETTEIARTLAYSKTVSLNRLYLMLRTGAFSSIAVYTRGNQLSHYVSASEAGMLVRWENTDPAWIRASVGADGQLPFQSWPSWADGRPPSEVPASVPTLARPAVTNVFPTAETTAIEVAVPVVGVVREVPHWFMGFPAEHVISDLTIGASSDAHAANIRDSQPQMLALIVFRKLLDRSALQAIASKTGKWPALFSVDGKHRQELTEFPLVPVELLREAHSSASSSRTHIVRRIVETKRGPFYAAVLPWQSGAQPRVMLTMALSRDQTLQNVQQTVTAILIVAGLILLLSVATGSYWVGRLIDPIVALTAAVKTIELGNASGPDGLKAAQLRPISVRAPDEIGDLAAAFNSMIAELRQSFETLEQRVLARTAELRQQTRYLRTLLDTIPLWVCLKDTEGRYLAANDPLARVCGLKSADEMTGKVDRDLWPPEVAEMVRAEEIGVMTAKRGATIVERSLAASTHEPVWVERFRTPVLDEDGTVLGVVGVSRDISTQKAAESAREAALAEAMRLAQLRSDFLARMSHELRTPLNAILGYAQILRQEQHLSERQTRGLAIIQSSGEHLLSLINDILDLARIDAGKLELAPTTVNLSTLLQPVADIIRVKAQEKALLFHYEEAVIPAAVQVDCTRLRQVLLNLLSNAIKFTDRGEISLRVQALPGPKTADSGSSVRLRFEVQDTGIGISEPELARIFQPFEQVGDAQRRREGSGLGLTISQEFIELMAGDIRVESQLGLGSRFSFELQLPLALDEAAEAPSEKHHAGYEGTRCSILIVDDAPENRVMLTDTLVPLGFEVFEARDGQEALARAQRCSPDLILMDVAMPVMDGLEATRRLRQLPAFAEVPIIAVSANATQQEATRCEDAGVDAFLAKPIVRDDLLQLIGKELGLCWVFEHAATVTDAVSDGLVIPPPEEMDLLHQLALEGNIRSIGRRAEYLASMDSRYAAFAAQLRSMASAYQSKAILSFVNRHRQAAV